VPTMDMVTHITAVESQMFAAEPGKLTVTELRPEEQAEVLDFLTERVANTFGMVGFIRSNGIVSPHNRGTFYACRNAGGQLEGVALIGHATLFEARSEMAIAAFSALARDCSDVFMLFGDQADGRKFWNYYSDDGRQERLYCRELLFELRTPVEEREEVPGLRLATISDLDLVVPVHAKTAHKESGVNPLEVDPKGFRRRCARRIEQGKTWVLVENGKLIFKAEIVTASPEVIYLEGIDVHPAERRNGHGMRCITQLSAILLERAPSVVLLVNEQNQSAQSFYHKAGYELIGYYDTIFLKQDLH
jgi:predicted GNAT family acetyltransferase